MPTTSAANNAAEGTPTSVSGTVTPAVTASSTAHRSSSRVHLIVMTSMLLAIHDHNAPRSAVTLQLYQGITW